MIIRNIFFLLIFAFPSFCDLIEEFERVGYVEICDGKKTSEIFDSLYADFDNFVDFLKTHPTWAHKLTSAKERFIRSKEKSYYSTDFFGLYDESKNKARGQISFYYSTHFHEFICSRYPEFNSVPEIARFLDACFEIQKPYGSLFKNVASTLRLEAIFSYGCGEPPLLFKVVKYLPSYVAAKPHYDGTAFSLFLDSTENEALLLSPYKTAFVADDFSSPLRMCSRCQSVLLIPGASLTEFGIYPTPHIVLQSSNPRYAAIAFAMRPNYTLPRIEHSKLPDFRH